jgi:hypothetical protein
MQHLYAIFIAMADSCLTILPCLLMLHVAAQEVRGLATLAHIAHQAYIVCSQLVQISNMLLPKHILSNSTL